MFNIIVTVSWGKSQNRQLNSYFTFCSSHSYLFLVTCKDIQNCEYYQLKVFFFLPAACQKLQGPGFCLCTVWCSSSFWTDGWCKLPLQLNMAWKLCLVLCLPIYTSRDFCRKLSFVMCCLVLFLKAVSKCYLGSIKTQESNQDFLGDPLFSQLH